jgi:hypothetical protein
MMPAHTRVKLKVPDPDDRPSLVAPFDPAENASVCAQFQNMLRVFFLT